MDTQWDLGTWDISGIQSISNLRFPCKIGQACLPALEKGIEAPTLPSAESGWRAIGLPAAPVSTAVTLYLCGPLADHLGLHGQVHACRLQ